MSLFRKHQSTAAPAQPDQTGERISALQAENGTLRKSERNANARVAELEREVATLKAENEKLRQDVVTAFTDGLATQGLSADMLPTGGANDMFSDSPEKLRAKLARTEDPIQKFELSQRIKALTQKPVT